jgi:peptidoglycan/LPS O-acetylase OafA/YrhL
VHEAHDTHGANGANGGSGGSGANGAPSGKNGFHAEPDRATVASARPRLHLPFLDSLRGLAALYVALGHSYVSMRPQLDFAAIPRPVLEALKLTDLGHFAVALFIVLSGFCLMLPVARSSDGRLNGGTKRFLRGRVRRIVPPYLAALFISVVLAGFASWVRTDGYVANPRPEIDLTAGSVLSHVFLVHNLFREWCQTINGPMWSVALEFQIYLFFPLLLLPLWRRFGIGASLLAAMCIGLAPGLLLPRSANLSWTYPWYIGLFGLGMAAAAICYSPKRGMSAAREKAPWGALAGILTVVCATALLTNLTWCCSHLPLVDTVLGLCASSFIVYCALGSSGTAATRTGPRALALRL